MTAGVSIHNVTQRYGTALALDGVSLEIAAGEFVVLLGPSGCGKTTLLNIIGGFAQPTSGTVLIGGRDMAGVAPKDRPTTTVFQDYALFPHMSVQQNVEYGLRVRGVGSAERAAQALEALRMVRLESLAGRKPNQLSGGQRQRIALARALYGEPKILVLDEPNANLDDAGEASLMAAVERHRNAGKVVFFISHRTGVLAVSDRILLMGEGRVIAFGERDEVLGILRQRAAF